MKRNRRSGGVLPGFGLTMGFTVFYLSLIVLIPLSALFAKSASIGWEAFWNIATNDRVLASFRVSFLTAFAAALINLVFGLLVAWVLVRYTFPGKRVIDGLIDLPFALPTAVAGISLTALYSENGWLGSLLYPLGIKSAFSPFGITVALVFIGLPFVVRSVQPVIQQMGSDLEEASATLGSGRWNTLRRIVFPELVPALLTGFALAFARGIGEYGSVVFISGNMPMKTEIAPLLIMTKLEQYDYPGAATIATLLLVLSFILLMGINFLQWRANRRTTA
ncbi:sulfate ABC transporter permease subunit CysT [Paenibacillus thermoaerophilus]|uniref:Sulfate transport system permease protein CysT n=1 Tax=Paenibacillus thermoaerophilus TaxID=1215385 RepID=A0ABW2V1E6_9BACL|nr:sulfate ABC transporter permease subunit CysT [Paenibacillus thermoaerophilus]TMV19011.1 sulfate ABC transporter permease subunit CysT [Paenibacillus thermoaerophilus]